MQYAIEYDVYGAHRVRVHTEGEGKDAKHRIERIGDEAGDPEISKDLPLHHMILIWAVCKDMEKRGRKLPPTRKEIESLVPQNGIKKLKKAGLLEEQLLAVFRDGKKDGSRACLLLTELGRRHCRSKYEKVSGDAEQAGSSSLGSLVGAGEGADSDSATDAGSSSETQGSTSSGLGSVSESATQPQDGG